MEAPMERKTRLLVYFLTFLGSHWLASLTPAPALLSQQRWRSAIQALSYFGVQSLGKSAVPRCMQVYSCCLITVARDSIYIVGAYND